MHFRDLTQIAIYSSALLLLTGCGNDLSTLEGTVLVDGETAPEGLSLQFTPTEPGGSPSYASTDQDGHYEANFSFREQGIQPGRHSVRLVPGGGGQHSMPTIGPDGKPQPASAKTANFPESYYEEIQTVTIEPGSNEIDLDLTTEPAA